MPLLRSYVNRDFEKTQLFFCFWGRERAHSWLAAGGGPTAEARSCPDNRSEYRTISPKARWAKSSNLLHLQPVENKSFVFDGGMAPEKTVFRTPVISYLGRPEGW
jgi:hypothetical protein